MALKRIRRQRRASITSLIDVIFLLLLFFMLASTFSKFSEVEIATAASGGEAEEAPDILELEVGTHYLRLDGKPLPTRSWQNTLRMRQTDRTIIALRVKPNVSTQRLTDVLADLNTISGLRVYVMEVP